MRYGWTWIQGDEDTDPDRDWIEVGPLDDSGVMTDEMCVLVLRGGREGRFKDMIPEREQTAQQIVDALNFYAGNPIEWTRLDEQKALREGWVVSHHTGKGHHEIQRYDEDQAQRFDSDSDAEGHVAWQASNGCELSMKALNFVRQ